MKKKNLDKFHILASMGLDGSKFLGNTYVWYSTVNRTPQLHKYNYIPITMKLGRAREILKSEMFIKLNLSKQFIHICKIGRG